MKIKYTTGTTNNSFVVINKDKGLSSGKTYIINDLGFQVGCLIERARITKGLTQKQLAKKIGSTQTVISRLESGSKLPSIEFLGRLVAVLGYRLIFTFGDEPNLY